jgi:hypothetical protein
LFILIVLSGLQVGDRLVGRALIPLSPLAYGLTICGWYAMSPHGFIKIHIGTDSSCQYCQVDMAETVVAPNEVNMNQYDEDDEIKCEAPSLQPQVKSEYDQELEMYDLQSKLRELRDLEDLQREMQAKLNTHYLENLDDIIEPNTPITAGYVAESDSHTLVFNVQKEERLFQEDHMTDDGSMNEIFDRNNSLIETTLDSPIVINEIPNETDSDQNGREETKAREIFVLYDDDSLGRDGHTELLQQWQQRY